MVREFGNAIPGGIPVKIWNALLLAAVLSGLAWSPAWSAEAPPVLGMLEIRGLDNLAGSAFELSKTTAKPVAREAVALMLYNVLGTMPGMGITPHGSLRVLLLGSDRDQGTVVLLLPVENEGKNYLENLGQAGWESKKETADGILHLLRSEIRDSGAGAIMVTHSHAAAALADRTLILSRSGLKLA